MKIGIIIICHNNEAQIDKEFLTEQINASATIELCFVDNDSSDSTLTLLKDVKEVCASHFSIVEIKKKTSEVAAKRAGARYMFNQFNLKHIGFVNVTELRNKGLQLSTIIENLCSNKAELIDLNLKTIEQQDVKQTLFKSVFSLVDYLKNINKTINHLNPSV
ncbi:MAG: family 2 glycosyl transferase [Winogradskyella sp.]|uniref:family 2 glycosyl transferase n=1 Tax=Winogradskyella sp. TaxID=1883156 RepID=UPI003858E9A1